MGDTSGKNEKVVEKADQECMEKPANVPGETAEKASEKQPAKQTETEKTSSESLPPGFVSSFKPVEDTTSDSKADVKPVVKSKTPDDDITPITSAPTVISLD